MTTELRAETIVLSAAELGPENPLPRFRSPADHLPVPVATELAPEDLRHYGYHQAERVLPHRLQDQFTRKRVDRAIPVLVLENDLLRATFTPQWGGRLWSLICKPEDRELLHRNPWFQPANLALREAWISGGIEWNMGRFGHQDYTVAPVFAARIPAPDGGPGLRLYEWDRVRGFPWQIDFWLPAASRFLLARVRLINPYEAELPNYWWTNIAVDESPESRVLAPADSILGLRPPVPTLAVLPFPRATVDGDELSYPGRCRPGGEQFYRIAPGNRKWIASVGADGRGFVQASTDRLLGRKCFFWGTGPGGRRWQEFLAGPGRAYLEIQAGLALAQAYSSPMPPRAVWTWTEAFGPLAMDQAAAHDPDYAKAWRAAESALESALPRARLDQLDAALAGTADTEPVAGLHRGSGWGALERHRRRVQREPDPVPPALPFGDDSLGADQAPWQALLEHGALPPGDPRDDPGAYLVQPEWRRLLETAVAAGRGAHWRSWYHLGVMRFEAREPDAAVAAWTESIRGAPSVWAYRCLAVAAERAGARGPALRFLELATQQPPTPGAGGVAIEYAQALNRAGRSLEALEFCERCPAPVRQLDRLLIEEVRARIATHRFEGVEDFFRHDFAVLREGEQSLRELWFHYQEQRLAVAESVPVTRALQERVRREFPPPHEIDFP